jgi:adenylate kinase
MKIMLFGAPGSGKGTQGERLAEKLGVPRLSTGDMLRAEMRGQTAIGRQIMDLMPTGQLIGDDVVIDLLKRRVGQADCQTGYILDGFPRTVFQAKAMVKAGISVDAIIELCVPDEAIVVRMAGRRFHQASGRSYHKDLNPPLVDDHDDVTGDPLISRDEDAEPVVRERLKIYREQTVPVLSYFKSLSDDSRPKIISLKADAAVNLLATEVFCTLGLLDA